MKSSVDFTDFVCTPARAHVYSTCPMMYGACFFNAAAACNAAALAPAMQQPAILHVTERSAAACNAAALAPALRQPAILHVTKRSAACGFFAAMHAWRLFLFYC